MTGQDAKANSIHKLPDFQLYRPSSCQEEGSSHLACSKATKSVVRIPFSFCFNFFTSSSSVANIEPSTEVDLSTASTKLEAEVEPVVPRIVCEKEEEEDMVANLRSRFKERQCKRLSKLRK